MPDFLIRSFSDPQGFTVMQRQDGTLPRNRSESYVPWGITLPGKVVYAKTGEHTGWRGGSGQTQLKPYDTYVSQNRRRLCQSELGLMALNNRAYTQAAVSKVSTAIRIYLKTHYEQDWATTTKCIFDQIGHYFFTNGGSGFGRLSQQSKDSVGVHQVWKRILLALDNGTLDQVLAIHDAVGRKVLPVLGGGPLVSYNNLAPIVRQAWFNDKRRGRVGRTAVSTDIGGVANVGDGVVGTVHQQRKRGVDSSQRDTARKRDVDGDAYYDNADTLNLLFGAGISGTTGTLLQSGIAFGGLTPGEELKQYTMAIIGYLVGGGMHSYHETMAVASRVGVPYVPGTYLSSLPTTFIPSHACRDWSFKYYDIVALGATHWRHNETCLPSHLNKALT
jgi:hypothetical protein